MWFGKKRSLAAALLPVLSLRAGSAHAAAATAAVLPQTLGWRNILFSTMVLVSIGALPLSYFGIGSLAGSLLVSASRCAIQVSLMGSLVLQRMMGATKPEIVAAWILGVGLIAGRTALSRIQYTYPNMNRNMYGSVVASGLSVLGLTLSLNLFGKVTPWFDPRTWIPIAGMLFGNTLNASALAASSITKQFATSSETVELRWMRGASTHEAMAPLVEESFKMSLMPTINGLAATGIIHIPGMMSGQILAGQSPQQASLYQIVINFLIASTALLSVQLIIHSSVRSIVDTKESRLRCGVLELKDIPTTTKDPSTPAASNAQGGQVATLSLKKVSPKTRTPITASTHVLELKGLEVPRANAKIDLALRSGDRVAISGKSGAGKTQILRTVIGLEELVGENNVFLFGKVVNPTDLPGFRSRVCLVSPHKPTLEGTPNQFYQQILKWNSQKQRQDATKGDPIALSDITKNWDLAAEILDRDWRTLSGGESQRAALAIALALQPDVLLLDESTSLLDKATSILVEKTLRESNIPMIVVTHSEAQLNRFCTHKLLL
jgi:putative ABC transport system permease protein